MVSRWTLGLLLVIGLLMGGVLFFSGDRDLRAIKRQSDRLTTALNKSEDVGVWALASRAREIADIFARKPTVTPGEPLPSITSREEMMQVAATTLRAIKSLEVRILDREVTWTRPHQEAAMRVAVAVTVEGMGERQKEIHAYELKWIREDGDWVIASVQPSASIRQPEASRQ